MTNTVDSDRIDERFRLRVDATAEFDGGRLVLSWDPRRFAIGPLAPGLAPVIQALQLAPLGEAALAAMLGSDDEAGRQLLPLLKRLMDRGWLERTLVLDQVPLATLRPVASFGVEPTVGTWPRVALSRFACLRRDGFEAVVESPRAPAVVVVHDPRVGALVASLAQPCVPAELEDGPSGLPAGAVRHALRLLADAGLTAGHDAQSDEEDQVLALAQWNFADLVFHSRSRFGRHQNGYGATWPLKGRFDSLPPKAHFSGRAIPLEHPEMDEVTAADPSFSAVLESRRSVREHNDAAPITVSQLGEFLYRVARVRTSEPQPDGLDRPYGSSRPYPTGGARYELEIYPVVGCCDGLDAGLYHYDPFEHQLWQLQESGAASDQLLQDGQRRSLMPTSPQVLIGVTARFGRVMYKYESMAYATILKNVGVLYQTMYCVATAMGLAPCALGGGSAEMLAKAAGLDYYAESGVGEFLLGSRVPLPVSLSTAL